MQNNRTHYNNHECAVFFRVPTPKTSPRLIRPNASKDRTNKTEQSSKTKKAEKPENLIADKKDINSEKIPKQKNNKIKKSTKKRNIDLQSYKIIFILKDVDPKDPTEELSSILSNSEVNFEIEKIERILDSKNKSMNKNELKIFNKK